MHRLLTDRISAIPLGDSAIKGFSSPVGIWRLIGFVDTAAAPVRPFIGRRLELAQIEGALASCQDSSSGLAIYIRGEAGIGKTRLAEEIARAATTAGFDVHKGLVLDFGTGKGQDAIRSVARSLLALAPASSPAVRGDAAERAVSDAMIDPEQRVHLFDLLDLPLPSELRPLYDAMDNDTRNTGKAETICTSCAVQPSAALA